MRYSLQRLLYNLKKDPAFARSNSFVQVGGRLTKDADGFCLTGGGLVVHLPHGHPWEDGDLVWIEFQPLDFAQVSDSHWRLNKMQSATTISKPAATFRLSHDFQIAQMWARFLQVTREYFRDQGLLEVTTPTLVRNPGMEPELEPFACELKAGSKRHQLFLATSPELHLKQLMVEGYTDVFEIKTVFRNEEDTEIHEPEFQMLEWYRGFSDLDAIVDDLSGYLQHLGIHGFSRVAHEKLKTVFIPDLFEQILGFSLKSDTSESELIQCLKKIGETPIQNASWNDLFHHLWVAKIEPQFPKGLVLLRDFPASQAALSKINQRGFADRFELVWDGVEIANAFHELTDPIEQRRRFERDQELRLKYGRTPLGIDENFMAALGKGLPPSGGIALGLDRLFLKLVDAKNIKATRPFGVRHQLVSK